MINIPKPLVDDFKWLARALPARQIDNHMQAFHVEDNATIVTTDGSRMHILTAAHGIPAGNYRLASRTPMILEAGGKLYPSWREVVPDITKMERREGCTRADAVAWMGSLGGVINLDFVTAAFAEDTATVYTTGPLDPMVVVHGGRTAVVMPIRAFKAVVKGHVQDTQQSPYQIMLEAVKQILLESTAGVDDKLPHDELLRALHNVAGIAREALTTAAGVRSK